MSVRRLACSVLAAGGVAVAVGCGGSGDSQSPSGQAGAPSAAVPTAPRALAAKLSTVDAALHHAADAWLVRGEPKGPLPHAVRARALYVQRAVRRLARRQELEAATVRQLRPRLAHEIRELTAAGRDLERLSAGWPPHHVAVGRPDPLGALLHYYRRAQSRFSISWQVLAAINFVESSFGRARSPSVAGAQGPMQFIPATWRTYGLGGDIEDPHDAILGAANLLRHDGAPADYARALAAYNPSSLYVDAVQRYARLIARDRDALYLLYGWRP